MIQVKLGVILNSIDTLQRLSQQNFKAKLAWQIARLVNAIESELQVFNQTRLGLITKYAQVDDEDTLITDENNNYIIKPENIEAFNSELNELINTEVELNVNKINFKDLEELDFTPNDLSTLEPFIEIE